MIDSFKTGLQDTHPLDMEWVKNEEAIGLVTSCYRVPVEVTDKEIYRSMGYGNRRPLRRKIVHLIQEMKEKALPRAVPRLIMGTGGATEITRMIGLGKRMKNYFDHADEIAIIFGTAGTELHELHDEYVRGGYVLEQFILDALATTLARKTLVHARTILRSTYPFSTLGVSLSPGNAGLPIHMQRTLSTLLPIQKIGLEMLDDSCMLTPLASVSALMGIGNYPEYSEKDGNSSCCRCPSPDCSLREYEFEKSLFQKLVS